jgi:uncharacterized membrane protein YbaN (DUF454 family)
MPLIKKFLLIVLGLSLILIGMFGLVLPILNGTLFLLVGFILLSFESTKVETMVLSLVDRSVLLKKWHKKLEKILRGLFKK